MTLTEKTFFISKMFFFPASLVGAPKVFQAVCRDMIFPTLKYFSMGHGRSDEPHRAYFLTYFIAVSFTAIGKTIRRRNFPIDCRFSLLRTIECYRSDYFQFLSDDICISELLMFRCFISESKRMATCISIL